MHAAMRGWLVAGLLLGTMAYAIAEDVTLTTYYPSPRGVYKELQTRETTLLATASGNVGIGHSSASSVDTKLDVSGHAKIRNDLTVLGKLIAGSSSSPIQIPGGSPQAGKVLTATDSSGNATWQTPIPKYQ